MVEKYNLHTLTEEQDEAINVIERVMTEFESYISQKEEDAYFKCEALKEAILEGKIDSITLEDIINSTPKDIIDGIISGAYRNI